MPLFQNFDAPKIVSDYGFTNASQPSHQAEEVRDGSLRRIHSLEDIDFGRRMSGSGYPLFRRRMILPQ